MLYPSIDPREGEGNVVGVIQRRGHLGERHLGVGGALGDAVGRLAGGVVGAVVLPAARSAVLQCLVRDRRRERRGEQKEDETYHPLVRGVAHLPALPAGRAPVGAGLAAPGLAGVDNARGHGEAGDEDVELHVEGWWWWWRI